MADHHLLVTEDQVRAAVIATASREVGKHYGIAADGLPNPTPYGQWYGGTAWARALFCAAGATWSWVRAVGEDAARTFPGYQTHGGVAPYRRGFVWTVALWEQLASRRIPIADTRPGDLILYRYPTSGTRNTAVVNHVDLAKTAGGRTRIGFNVPRPGGTGDQSRGGGVWERGPDGYQVGAIRMPAAEIAAVNRDGWRKVQQALQDLGFGTFQMTGTPGPATAAAVATYSTTYNYPGDQTDWRALLTHLEDTVTQLARIETHLTDIKNTLDSLKRQVADVPERSAVRVLGRRLPSVGATVEDAIAGTNIVQHAARKEVTALAGVIERVAAAVLPRTTPTPTPDAPPRADSDRTAV